MRRTITPLVVVIALSGLAACGSDADPDPAAETPAAAEPVATDSPVATDPPATDPPADTGSPPAEAPAGDGVAVTLVEWAVEAPAELAAGAVTFDVSNGGSFPHELVVIAGDGYESLPLAPNGAVVEDDLPPGSLIGRTDRIPSGSTGTITVDLAPGDYVLLCNIAVGPNSHAGAGQTMDVTVT